MMLKRGGIKSKLLLVVGVFGVAAAAASFNFAHNRAAATVPGVNKIVSLVSTGVQTANQGTELQQQLSADGKFVLFSSASTDLVANDTNGKIDLFVRNVQAGTTERVNVATNGTEANEGVMPDNSGLLREAVISADGRYVLFASKATNLVSTTFTSNTVQFYIRDRQLGTTTLMGVNDAGDPGDQYTGDGARPVGISSDGRIATYITAARNTGPMQFIPDGFSNPQYSYQYLYTKNLLTGKVKLLTPVNT
ncbi:MAG TPA: hypothetical protein VD735_00200, partial [Candidatus Saccharimonadales bacterium]|nr:hypothetical protein [Candidatus Saccharimonadales bacterium]